MFNLLLEIITTKELSGTFDVHIMTLFIVPKDEKRLIFRPFQPRNASFHIGFMVSTVVLGARMGRQGAPGEPLLVGLHLLTKGTAGHRPGLVRQG